MMILDIEELGVLDDFIREQTTFRMKHVYAYLKENGYTQYKGARGKFNEEINIKCIGAVLRKLHREGKITKVSRKRWTKTKKEVD